MDPRFTKHPKASTERELELEQALEDDPENEDLLSLLAFIRYTNQRYPEAFEIYSRIMGRSRDPAVHFYAGNTLYRLRSYRAAVGAWQKAVVYDTAGLYRDRAQQRIQAAQTQKKLDGPG